MKNKFWIAYLTVVFLFTGIGYFAIGNVPDIPLALSDAEMSVLRGTVGSNERCILLSEPGCDNKKCEEEPAVGIAYYGYRYNDCQPWNGWYCNYWGPHDAQIICRAVFYLPDCSDYIWEWDEKRKRKKVKIRDDTTSNCNSRLLR